MTGYTREDLARGEIDWLGMTPPEYRHFDEESVRELKETGVNHKPFEKEYIRKDGTRVPVILAGAMLDEGRTSGVAFVLDITDRKRAEEQIKTSETRYRRLFESAKDGILILNRESGDVMDANPFMESLSGYSPGRARRKTPLGYRVLRGPDCVEGSVP
jgi:PAS domain S-box-containing protein